MNLSIFKSPFKLIIFAAICIVIAVFTWRANLFQDQHIVAAPIETQKQTVVNGSTEPVARSENSVDLSAPIDAHTSEKAEEHWTASPAQVAELTAWQESRGLYDASDKNKDDYGAYSKETLAKLADNCDIKALQFSAYNKSAEEKKSLLTKAAVCGSTFALKLMAISIETDIGYSKQNASDAEKRATALEALSYMKVALLRSDLSAMKNGQVDYITNKYKIEMDEQDLKFIDKRASEIYSDLEMQRIQKGLGKFDNNLPPIVMLFYKSSGLLK